MPKSMKQPDREDSAEYFTLYIQDQIDKITAELKKVDKRISKVKHASNLYIGLYGRKINLNKE